MSIHKISKIDPKSGQYPDELLYKYFLSKYRKGYIEVTEKKYCLPEYYAQFLDQIENFEVHDSDVWVTSHPKTGTTWTQEMAWCIGHNLDYKAAQEYIFKRFPFLEVSSLFDVRGVEDAHEEHIPENSVTNVSQMKSPRYIKTHLPWDLLPRQIRDGTKTPKIMYVYRNPKDTCVSYFHHCQAVEGYTGDFETFVELFLNGRVCYGPFPEHVKSFIEQKDRVNMLILKYEDLKKEMPSQIDRVAKFLNKKLSLNDIATLTKHLSFESMKSNVYVNYEIHDGFRGGKFMRSGRIGSYKAEMTSEMIGQFEKWANKHFSDTEINFPV